MAHPPAVTSGKAICALHTNAIDKGFRFGFSNTDVTCHLAERNLLSASSNPEVISKYLAEVTLGRVDGPLSPQQVPGVHISPFSVIPKGHTPGKWRLTFPVTQGGA